ncbi:PH domain-containing protein [Paenibacillus yanchengensis]|uniref:PH domain-containing protein n=1 Tax=Paenibacillus yanchengensis TaxID=2035833 RepID=A0ABW4YJ04_9BACL
MKIDEQQKLHKLYIVDQSISLIKVFWPLFLIIVVKEGVNSSAFLWMIGGSIAIFLLGLLFSYIGWKRFSFTLMSDRIMIHSGVFFREEKTIYYGRIHSVNVQQKLLHRLFGIAQVMIETPGGKEKSDGVLSALSLSYANELAVMLRNRKMDAQQSREADADHVQMEQQAQEIVASAAIDSSTTSEEQLNPKVNINLKTSELLKAAATSLNFGLAIAFIAGLYSFGSQFLDVLLPESFIEDTLNPQYLLRAGLIVITLLVLAVIAVVWLLSLLLYVIKYSGFTMKEQQDQLLISYGLFEKKTFVIDPAKVQAVLVRQSWLRKPFGYVEIGIQVVSAEEKENLVLHPFIALQDVNGILQQILPKFIVPEKEKIVSAPKRAFLYYWRTPLIIALLLTSALFFFFEGYALWSLGLVPLIWLVMRASYKAAGVLLEKNQLTLRFGALTKTICLIHRPQIVSLSITRTRGQRRKQLLTISAHALGSLIPYKVKCLDEQHILPVWMWYRRNK